MHIMHALCLVGLAVGAAMPLVTSAQSTTPEDPQLVSLIASQEAAWNRGDGKAWAAAFTGDADFINIRGDIFHGQEMIARRHAMIFSGPYQGSHSTIIIRQITELAPGVALIETDHDVRDYKFLPPGIQATEPGVLKTHLKYVAVKKEGQWRLVAAQNTAIAPPAPMPAAAK